MGGAKTSVDVQIGGINNVKKFVLKKMGCDDVRPTLISKSGNCTISSVGQNVLIIRRKTKNAASLTNP